MIIEKWRSIEPILKSNKGTHLTAYLTNTGHFNDFRQQLSEVIKQANEYLSVGLEPDQIKDFLEPLDYLNSDDIIFKNIKHNVAIFRTSEYFRVLSIPISIENQCHVASSFHIKPLLRWLQDDQDYLFLGIDQDSAHLYFGNQNIFKHIRTIPFAESTKIDFTCNLNNLINQITHFSQPKLFLSAKPQLIKKLRNELKYQNIEFDPISHSFKLEKLHTYKQMLRLITKEDSLKKLDQSLQEFRFAENENQATKNIYHIAQAAAHGQIEKLLITDEINIFGKIDSKSGHISIHPFDLDHEDDCILDDLAQLVLSQGGEVTIAKMNEIPNRRPIIALTKTDNKSKSYSTSYELYATSI